MMLISINIEHNAQINVYGKLFEIIWSFVIWLKLFSSQLTSVAYKTFLCIFPMSVLFVLHVSFLCQLRLFNALIMNIEIDILCSIFSILCSYHWPFWDENNWCCHPIISNFFDVTLTVKVPFFLFTTVSSAYLQISHLISFGWTERPQGIHIDAKFVSDTMHMYVNMYVCVLVYVDKQIRSIKIISKRFTFSHILESTL